MPFTLAHPAAVIPFYKARPRTLVLSALIIGSIAPDTEYFVRRQLISAWGHTLVGLITFCLPVGLILLWLYHTVQKEALLSLLPTSLQQRLAPWSGPCSFVPMRRFGQICLSTVLGATIHLLWDSLTHANGLPAQWNGIPTAPITTIAGIPITIYRVLQDGSTLIDLFLVLWWGWHAIMRVPPCPKTDARVFTPRTKLQHWTGILVTSVVLAGVIALQLQAALSTDPVRRLLQQVVLSGVPAVYLTLTGYGILYLRWRRWTAQHEPTTA